MSDLRSASLLDRARQVIPGGVNSPVRAFKSVGGTPRFIDSAEGAFLKDVDGNQLLDFVGSWGVMILGHAHPDVTQALHEAVRRGTSFGTPTEQETELAELIVSLVPSIDVVRLVCSGTEATMSAIRLARAATNRSHVVKFRGGYHGHGDSFLVEAGSGSATLGVPSSPGVPSGTAADTLVADYNDLQSVRNLFEERNGQIAAVIVEPVAGNMGCIPPIPGFLGGLRKLCDDAGTLLVFDEVMTGFRVGPAGAQELYGITPDLTTLGKVVGGGLPIGAYGGGEKLMRMVAPDGPVYQAGTLSGNPIAVAAGLTTLKTIQADGTVYDHLVDCGAKLAAGFDELATRLGMPLCWNGVGGMGSLFFSEGPVVDWSSAADGDESSFNLFFHGMLEAGIHLPPSRFETWFWSNAHRSEDIERTIGVAERVLTRTGGAAYA